MSDGIVATLFSSALSVYGIIVAALAVREYRTGMGRAWWLPTVAVSIMLFCGAVFIWAIFIYLQIKA